MGSDFKKTWDCPTSQTLSSYLEPDSVNKETSYLAVHLAKCEFCAAESQLLSKLPPEEYCGETPAMPAALRALAEALLVRRDLRSFVDDARG
jgi:hypothetical protein